MLRFRQSESASSCQGALSGKRFSPTVGLAESRGGGDDGGLPFWTRATAIVVDVRQSRRRWETGSLVRNKEKRAPKVAALRARFRRRLFSV